MNVIDLFAGCGGLSQGFEMAGYNIPIACEWDQWAADTYELNHPNTKMIRGDIKKVVSWKKVIADTGCKIDGIIGGPSCQGFSLNGNRDPKDPRNSLFMEFARCVSEVKPAFFLMENVPGILSMKTASGDLVQNVIGSVFDSAGYSVRIRVINAVDCGVPQSRRRVFFFGFRNDVKPDISWEPKIPRKSVVTVDMAISDLPRILAGEGLEKQSYLVSAQSDYQKWARKGSKGVYNHVAMRHTDRLVNRFKTILPGQSVADVSGEHSALKRGNPSIKSGKVYSQNNQRVVGYLPCPTVAASFQSNFIHPQLNRNFTAREGARLQSFPDTYIFKGDRTTMSWETRLSQYKQIGNAVPCLLAMTVAKAITATMGAGK